MIEVALCMIVRDGADTLPRCLASVRPHVDEVCIYDTGSTDGTLDLLHELAAGPGPPLRVERGEWRDDYAWAREQSVAMTSAEWLLTLDADDELRGGHNLRALVAMAERDRLRSVQALYDFRDDAAGGVVSLWVDRLVRRGSGRWCGAIHEFWRFPSFDPALMLIANPSAFYVYHQTRNPGAHRHLAAIRRAAADPGRTPRALWYLGAQLLTAPVASSEERLANALEAASALDRFLTEDPEGEEWSLLRWEAFRHAAVAYRRIGYLARAKELERAGRAYELRWRRAVEAGVTCGPTFAHVREAMRSEWEGSGRPTRDRDIAVWLEPLEAAPA